MLPENSLQRLENQHLSLLNYMPDFSSSLWQQPIARGKWSMQQHLAHLGRYQIVFEERIDEILTENKPIFGRYKAEEDPLFADWENLDVAIIWQKIRKDRQLIFQKIKHLSSAEFVRIGRHPLLHDLTIGEWTEFFLLHEAHHLYAIFRFIKIVDGKEVTQ